MKAKYSQAVKLRIMCGGIKPQSAQGTQRVRVSIFNILSVLSASLCFSVLMISAAFATDTANKRSVQAVGRKAVTVTTKTIRFGDLAYISSNSLEEDDIVIGLQKIYIENSPDPGKATTISAAKVLERLREEEVDIKQIGYRLPRVMSVKRAARVISEAEIKNAMQEALSASSRDIVLRSIDYQDNVYVAPGALVLQARPYNMSLSGRIGFNIVAKVPHEKEVKFNVTAIVDEWREVPVAVHALSKGSIVRAGDIMRARLNISAIPKDAAQVQSDIVGYEVNQNIAYGEVFRRNKLAIPPVIENGSKVILLYQSRLLRATASGIALQSGIVGESIKIRNDASKRIIVGKVLEPGLVGVTP